MSERNDGGPAFPGRHLEVIERFDEQLGCVTASMQEVDYQGMSLRDYFAAKAMQGMLSDRDRVTMLDMSAKHHGVLFAVEVAGQAYDHADAMLAEREK